MRQRLLQKAMVFAVVLGIPAGIVNYVNILSGNVRPIVVVQICTYFVCVIAYLLRKYLPFTVLVLLGLGVLYTLGLTSLMTFGLTGTGRVEFLLMSVLALVMLGVRAGVIAFIFSVITLLALLIFSITGIIPAGSAYGFDLWLQTIIGYSLDGIIMVYCLLSLYRAFQRTIQGLEDRRAELQETNAHLAEEIANRQRAQEERGRLEEHVEQAQRLESLGVLAGGIAHDFNNILSAMIGFTDLAKNRAQQDERLTRYLDQVLQAGMRARELVQQILAFSRRTERERKAIHIQPVVKEAMKLLHGSLPSTIAVREEIAAEAPRIVADATEIHQIVMNLCTNAYHAMRDTGGDLHLTLGEVVLDAIEASQFIALAPGNYLRLTVSDTGCGMDTETIQRIFEPYFTTKGLGDGTGLGLSTVHGIVKSCGGAIGVESQPGKGTTFTIYFPLATALSDGAGANAAYRELPRGTERVLAVDDERPITEVIERALTMLGYSVTICHDGQEALELFLSAPNDFDVLLTDQTMPRMTGLALTKEVLAIRPEMPVIMCTGFSELVDEHTAKRVGIKAFMMKPLTTSELAMVVRRVLDSHAGTGTKS